MNQQAGEPACAHARSIFGSAEKVDQGHGLPGPAGPRRVNAAVRTIAACSAPRETPLTDYPMSKKHPIISVTGSSGAGTSTVKGTFDQIFRREGDEARCRSKVTRSTVINRADDENRVGEALRRGRPNGFSTFQLRGQRAWRSWSEVFRDLRRDPVRARPGTTCIPTPRPNAEVLGSPPGHLHRLEAPFDRGFRPAVLRRPARRGGERRPSTSRSIRRSQDRSGAGHQPRVDPEDPP